MKKFAAVSATALAVLTAGTAVATPSMARDYRGYSHYDDACRDRQKSSGTTGAVVGGVAGALLGSSLASDRGNRAGGAAIGAVAGALLGNSVGRSTAKSSGACEARDYGRVSYRERGAFRGYDNRSYDNRSYGYRDYGYSRYGY